MGWTKSLLQTDLPLFSGTNIMVMIITQVAIKAGGKDIYQKVVKRYYHSYALLINVGCTSRKYSYLPHRSDYLLKLPYAFENSN